MTENRNYENLQEVAPTFELLSTLEKGQALRLADAIVIEKSDNVLSFGKETQEEIAGFTDRVLYHIRNKDITRVGDTLKSLLQTLEAVNVDDFEEQKQGFFSRLFKPAKANSQVIRNYERINTQIERIDIQLQRAQKQLLQDIDTLEQLFHVNQSYYGELNRYIAAGELKRHAFASERLPQLKTIADSSENAFELQAYNDAVVQLERLDQRIYDLQIARELTVQSAPQIRMMQQANHQLVEKIQMSIMTMIPLWKQQITMILNLQKERRYADMQQRLQDVDSKMANTAKQVVYKNSQTPITRFKATQDELVASVSDTLSIQSDISQQRDKLTSELSHYQHKN